MALGKLDIIIASDTAQMRKDMSTAVNIMQSSTKAMESFAKSAASAIGGYFAFDILQSQIQQTLDFADSLSKLSQKTGITADGLYSLSAAAKLSDVSFEDMSKSLGKFSKSIGENSKTFDTLGLSIKNNDGTLKNSFDLLGELADKFSDMPDGASKATLAMQLFGKSGADIIPLLNSGSEALKEYLGVMDGDTAKASEAFNDSMTKIGIASNSFYLKIVKDVSPVLGVLSEDISNATKETNNLIAALEKLGSSSIIGLIERAYAIKGGVSAYVTAASGVAETVWNASFITFDEAGKSWNKTKNQFFSDIDETQKKINQLNAVQSPNFKKEEDKKVKNEFVDDYLSRIQNIDASSAWEKVFDDQKTAFEKAQEDKKKALSDYKKSYDDIQKEIAKSSMTEFDAGIFQIEEKAKKYKEDGQSRVDIEKYIFNAKMELGIKQLEQETKDREEREKEVKAQYNKEQDAMLGYYKAVGMESDAFYLEEVMKLQKLADAGILSNSQMLEVWTKDNEKFQDEQFKKSHEWLYDFFDNMDKALDNKLLD